MESEIQINNTAGVCQIDIEGTIGVPEEWQFEEPDARVATYERFRDTLRRIAEIEAPEVVVNIRSTGGDVNDALLIHDALRQLPARVTTRCYGYTASAATIIAQAASEGCRRPVGQCPLSDPHGHLFDRGKCRGDRREDRPAAPDRCAYRRGLCIPFGASGRGVRGPDGREQRQRPLARHPRRPLRRDWPTKWSKLPEQPASSLARNIARGWERLLANIGLRPGPALPADRNVLHFDGEVQALRSRSAVAADEARRQAAPTSTQPREDPSCGDTVRSANERAYAEDARRMRN